MGDLAARDLGNNCSFPASPSRETWEEELGVDAEDAPPWSMQWVGKERLTAEQEEAENKAGRDEQRGRGGSEWQRDQRKRC